MKTNKKALELVEKGLSSKTVSNLTEEQVKLLHSRLVEANVTTQPFRGSKITIPVNQSANVAPNVSVSSSPTGSTVTTQTESESEDDDDVTDGNSFGKNQLQKYTDQQGPHDANDMAPDGMDDDSDDDRKMMGMEETKKNNPWAICTASVGRSNKRKYEMCVKDVKKSLDEGKNPVSLFLENKIMEIIEKHVPPKIKKSDLIKFMIESSPKVAPSKPKTEPATKPGKPDTKPSKPSKPSHPFKNPNPGEKEVPKAKKKETNEAGPAVAPSKPKTEPTTKPGKPGVKPSNPVKPAHPLRNPNPGEKEVPKAVSPEDAKDKVIDVIINILQK